MLLIVCTWCAVALNYNLNRHTEYVQHMIYLSVPQIRPPFCNLSLSKNRRGGLYAGCDIFSRNYAPHSIKKYLAVSVDAGFVLALPFHHGDLEPHCVGVSTRGGVGAEREGRDAAEHRTRGGEMLPTLAVGWQASASRD